MSDLARKLIAENKRTGATFLDLGNCGLTEIPAEVGELIWLESLTFASEWTEWDGREWQQRKSQNSGEGNRRLTDLAALSGLSALQTLYVSNTEVSDLAALSGLSALQTLNVSGTQVSDLAALSGLSAPQTLNVSGTQVSDLAAMSGLSALQRLDVSGTQVSDLGALSGLSALQELHVPNTQVSDLAALSGLSALQKLVVYGTQVSDLGALSGLTALQTLNVSDTQVSDPAALSGLSALQELNLSNTQVANLSPLEKLHALQRLFLAETPVSDISPVASLTGPQTLSIARSKVHDLAPVTGLGELQILYASDTLVTDLVPLANLTSLQRVVVSNTKVRDVSPLAKLATLRVLGIATTLITDLTPLTPAIQRGVSVKWSSWWSEDDGIYVEDCPLTIPPPEIVEQGNEAILNYFAERALGEVDHLYEAKMLILGEGGAGKTSLLRRLYQPDEPLPTEDETTKGIAIYRHEFELNSGRTFRLNVWDFGGQQIYHATHQFFLTHRSLYVLVDDTRKDYKAVSDEGFKYWLELIDVFSEHSPTLIFQNEKGGRSKQIDLADIRQRFDNVKEVYAGNLDNRDAVKGVRDGIEHFASHLSHIGEEVPARWIKVREEIETLAASEPYVPLEDYFEIYRKHIEFDETRALLLSRYLHDLGVFLHFQDDPLLARTVILQNDWATHAVFRILDDETVKKELGRFNRVDCARVWKDSAYAKMHPELLALMQKFELCYELRDSQPQTWLAPQLLAAQRPASLGEWASSTTWCCDIAMNFCRRA